MAKKTGAILVLVALTLVAASPTAFSQRTAPAIGAQRSGAAQGPSASTVRFKTFSYVDRQGTGTEAFRVLVPSDWQFQGGITWVLDNPGMPA